MQTHIDPSTMADFVAEMMVEYDLFELSTEMGVDLLAFAEHVLGEDAEERAARLAAAADMLADDPTLYVETFRLASRSLGSASSNRDAAIYLLPTAGARLTSTRRAAA
ncbi:hypothetical protein [Kitasatospora sp. NPDC002965]|uniref:hypothetical protein n=1 Tax=Kitasatospora sp. NPDC002965 TaxID=3154775 RepID=UPI0033A80C2D